LRGALNDGALDARDDPTVGCDEPQDAGVNC
jgi:hypothetical protein